MAANESGQYKYQDYGKWPPTIELMLTILQLILSTLVLLCNALTSFLIIRKRVPTRPFNIFLLNLSVTDTVGTLFMLPIFFIDPTKLGSSELNGDVICSALISMIVFLVCASVNVSTLTIMAVNRYLSLRYPLWYHARAGIRNAVLQVCCSWFLTIVGGIPCYISYKYDQDIQFCSRQWPEGFNAGVYTSSVYTISSIFPVITMITFYAFIYKHYRKGIRNRHTSIRIRWQARRQKIFLLGYLIINFFVWWSPAFFYLVFASFNVIFREGPVGKYQEFKVARIISLLVSINFILDPILYGLISTEFRRALRQLFRKRVRPENVKRAQYPQNMRSRRKAFTSAAENHM